MLVRIKNIANHEEILEHINGLTGWYFRLNEIREIETKQMNLTHFFKKIKEKKNER